MNKIPSLKYLIPALLLVTVAFLLLKNKTSTYTLAEAFKSEQTLDENLKKCLDECSASEARYAKRLLETTPENKFPVMTTIIDELMSEYEKKNDPEDLADIYAAADLHASTLDSFGAANPAFQARVHEAILNLPLKFPNNPKAFSLLGSHLSHSRGPAEKVIEAFQHCLKLDPNHTYCRSSYDESVKTFTEKRCLGVDIKKSFGISEMSLEKKIGFTKEMIFNKTTYYLPATPSLDHTDINFTIPVKDENGVELVRIEMTPEGTQKFETFTAKNTGRMTAIVLDEQIITTPFVQSTIKTGIIQLRSFDTTGSDPLVSLFQRTCEKLISHELPAELRI